MDRECKEASFWTSLYSKKKISVASSSTGVKLEETEELEYELCWFDKNETSES